MDAAEALRTTPRTKHPPMAARLSNRDRGRMLLWPSAVAAVVAVVALVVVVVVVVMVALAIPAG